MMAVAFAGRTEGVPSGQLPDPPAAAYDAGQKPHLRNGDNEARWMGVPAFQVMFSRNLRGYARVRNPCSISLLRALESFVGFGTVHLHLSGWRSCSRASESSTR